MSIASSLSRSPIASIQSGTISMSNGGSLTGTASISSVNTSKAVCLSQGEESVSYYGVRVELTNATTVTASRGSTSNDMDVGYVVIEFI